MSLLLFVTLISVVCGVCSFAPGIGIPLAMLVIVPFVRTALLVRARAKRGRVTPWKDRIGLAFVSAWTIVLMNVAACVVGCVALVSACFVALSVHGGLGKNAETIFFGLLAVAAVGIVMLIGNWARRRWQRDVNAE